jgi:hypothetical protein
MRVFICGGAFLIGILTLCLTASAQAPARDKGPDRPGPRPGDAAPPRDAPRLDDDGPPPPGKGPRGRQGGGRSDSGSFGEGFGRGMRGGPGGGFGGGGGGGGGFRGGPGINPGPGMMPGGMMPGGPGMFGGGYGAMPPDDPEMRELIGQDDALNEQAHAIAAKLHESTGDDRATLRKHLTEVVNQQFDVRQKRRELQLKRMEEELKRLRDTIAKRNDSRSSIVENHIREMIGEPRDLDF